MAFLRDRILAVALLALAACSDSSSIDATHVFADPGAARLAAAVAKDDATEVGALVKGGANANSVGDKGTSLLQWALLNQSKGGFRALIAAGANPAHADEAGETVMHYAARNTQGATFQAYLNMTPSDVLSDEARQERERLHTWMKARRVPLEDSRRSR